MEKSGQKADWSVADVSRAIEDRRASEERLATVSRDRKRGIVEGYGAYIRSPRGQSVLKLIDALIETLYVPRLLYLVGGDGCDQYIWMASSGRFCIWLGDYDYRNYCSRHRINPGRSIHESVYGNEADIEYSMQDLLDILHRRWPEAVRKSKTREEVFNRDLNTRPLQYMFDSGWDAVLQTIERQVPALITALKKCENKSRRTLKDI